ncbi:MAG: sigma-54 dependent transcriptional regulator [candidate division Zixibacteria bacterium]|nr:sigma-54 dependent transcriptional regulator [candidate division Zixibacteria bacterium]
MISSSLSEAGFTVDGALTGKEAMEKLARGEYDLVVSDIRLPSPDGLEILRWLTANRPETIVIMMTAFGEVKTAVEAMKAGADDYLIKPFPLDELLLQVRRLLERRRTEQLKDLREKDFESLAYDEFIGSSSAAAGLMDLVKKVAATDTTVLITGESGSGKELVARMTHHFSSRRGQPFIPVNCAALTETLLESELFGHEKGAFTGAVARKAGRFELADGGTIFLDEIGEMSPALQAKLLRVLEERRLVRVGGVDMIPIDVRLITATNRNLKELVKSGAFREDLYFRVNVFPLAVPALRERIEDIPTLTRYFLQKMKFPYPDLDSEVIACLQSYHWPGNIRELKNILERAVILAGREPIDIGCVGLDDDDLGNVQIVSSAAKKSLGEAEKQLILDALRRGNGNKTEAAKMLGITRRRLYSRMKIHGLES